MTAMIRWRKCCCARVRRDCLPISLRNNFWGVRAPCCGITVRAWPRDVTVTNVQDVDPPVLFYPRRPVFVAGLQQIMAEPEMEEQEDVEEIPVGELVMYIPVVYGVAV